MRPSELEVTHAFAQVNGLRMHYVAKGPGDGPLVVLLHGFPEMWWSWRHQIGPLAAAGYRVLAPDMRGYNDTERKGPYTLDVLADDIRALIEHAGVPRARVVAHDWGGAVGWHLAGRHPDVVERLAVLNCPHPTQMQRAVRTRPRQLKRSWYMFYFLLPYLPERLLTANDAAALAKTFRAMAVDPTHYTDEDIAPFREAIQKPGAASAMLEYYRTALKQGLFDRNFAARTARITTPTLLLWAMDDKALGYDDLVPGTERYVENLTVQTVERCGHFLQSEKPAEVNARLLAFLAR